MKGKTWATTTCPLVNITSILWACGVFWAVCQNIVMNPSLNLTFEERGLGQVDALHLKTHLKPKVDTLTWPLTLYAREQV